MTSESTKTMGQVWRGKHCEQAKGTIKLIKTCDRKWLDMVRSGSQLAMMTRLATTQESENRVPANFTTPLT